LGEARQGPRGGHELHRSEEQRAAEGQPFNATRIETIDEMAKRGVQFGVCDTASHGLARRLAGPGGDADATYKEMVASMIPSSRLLVAGVIGVTRAQEYGYSVVYAG
jgi:hypothetical protein